MRDFTLPKYEHAKRHISKLIEEEQDELKWEDLEESYDTLHRYKVIESHITQAEWIELIQESRADYFETKNIEKTQDNAKLISHLSDNDTFVPPGEESSWVIYKNKLLNSGWSEDSVNNLENSTESILKKLNREDNSKLGPVKGLVVGQVQSGKTASMAGLMAMAADWRWNTFIVLSGMVENLRAQTQRRLRDDLDSPNYSWISLPNLSKNLEAYSTSELKLEDGSRERYLNVVLKNKARLENLINWFEEDPNKLEQMRILIIDDEADQASINTKNSFDSERAKINELILRLVNVGESINRNPLAMNYISYTATPYANVLNESGKDTLYPDSFISLLPTAKEYFGPKQIFGYENQEALGITREIPVYDLEDIQAIQNGDLISIPNSLKESLTWFLTATAVRRFQGAQTPTSMLVHTSQRQAHHQAVAKAIEGWLKLQNDGDLLELCEIQYNRERELLSIDKFRDRFKSYPNQLKIKDYPDFEDLKSFIIEIKNKIAHIKMNENEDLDYHQGIHLCIDNCAHNGIDDENQHVRLAYPKEEQEISPAFIIVGGSTLSRGLTIEGLVSTYFLRATIAGDSLLQMGRWFGYRKGYELLPRIWMTNDTLDKFNFLTELEEDLKEEIAIFANTGRSPSEYGPKIKNTPKLSWLRVTAKNKMQSAEEVDLDFAGTNMQTTHFEDDQNVLTNNLQVTKNFIKDFCGLPKRSISVKSALIFENVPFESIKTQFLRKMIFNTRTRAFNNIETFISWYEKAADELNFDDWNVILAGKGKVTQGDIDDKTQWKVKDFNVGKVTRSVKTSINSNDKRIVDIGVLRGQRDIFADIFNKDFNKINSKKTLKVEEMNSIRKKFKVDKKPQLILYRIDKNSTARENSAREDLAFKEDVIGVFINIPGSPSNKPHAKAVQIIHQYDEYETIEE